MAKAASTKPKTSDPDFQHAVSLVDSGNVDELWQWLDARPDLLTDHADEDGSFAGDYFAHPKLLWFTAENPIRNGQLPANIVEVIQTIVDVARKHDVAEIKQQMNYTLALVASGCVAQECGLQTAMMKKLVALGADPNSGITSSLAHAQVDACSALLECGATPTLPILAGLGRTDDVQALIRIADPETLQAALALAAINGQSDCARILLDNGADPNQFNPEGLHGHSTPLHQAVSSGSVPTVCCLVTRGADLLLKDTVFHKTATEWAQHAGKDEVLAFLHEADVMMPAVRAVQTGDVEALQQWLMVHTDKVNSTLGDNPRTLLHYATDWPGKRPRVDETIATLVAGGADVNVRCRADSSNETPLHWAASTDDVDAASALIQAGADLDPTGGCIGDGTPLVLAVIFQNLKVANLLVEAGATIALPLIAGMGRMDLAATFFTNDEFKNPYPSMPQYDSVSQPQLELDGAICLAAMAGQQEMVEFVLERGSNVNMFSVVKTTPLDEAANNGHVELARYLISVGAKSYADLELAEAESAQSDTEETNDKPTES